MSVNLSAAFILALAIPAATASAAVPMRGATGIGETSERGVIQLAKRSRSRIEPDDGGPSASASDLPGRYAVMRDKRDTGCMVTLDRTRSKGGARAQLAPGCRDQGIVIFDPAAWQVVRGELVLTARAGHKAHLMKEGEGAWKKDPKDGGKPLGLKKL